MRRAKRMTAKPLHLVHTAAPAERKPRGWRCGALRHLRSQGLPGLVALALSIPAFFAFDRRPPVTILSGTADPDKVTAGKTVTIHWELKWNRTDCSAVVSGELISERGFVWKIDDAQVRAPQDGDGASREVSVPWTFVPGTVRYRATVYFTCNWLQRTFNYPIAVKTPDVAFLVTSSPATNPAATKP
jgi:hypothetical protein